MTAQLFTRVPQELKDAIEDAALVRGMSQNSLVIAILEDGLSRLAPVVPKSLFKTEPEGSEPNHA